MISSDQLARVVRAVLQGKVLLSEQAAPHDLWRNIEAVTRLLEGLEDWRERAIVAVDESGTVDRYALGIAASMGAAKLYDLLERHGRPRSQTRLTQVEVLESRVTSENGEWDAARVVATMSSYGWEIDDKRGRALLRALTEQEVLEKIPNRGGRAVYEVVGPRDWLYCLDPERDTIENGPSTPARVARLARENPGPTEWWLGRPLKRMRENDRLWIYFGGVEGKIAAMAHVKSSPRPAPIGSQKPYEVDAELDLKATTALCKSPVRLEEMDQKHPQACGEMRTADVKLAEARANL
ncbi:hypothetical protein [Streptomyces sp. CB02460]|uniref:hypothetical protein n=1 Tax=Streptomyces sp. CB02460 TaxID=1703941 RepID=UPI000A43D6FE|nr:hypothetical protein [Streptomyces sp. CB02460]